MTAARLTQERGEMKVSPIIIINDSKLFYDPVENNDFWFNHGDEKSNTFLLKRRP